jgi:hypothetical protein
VRGDRTHQNCQLSFYGDKRSTSRYFRIIEVKLAEYFFAQNVKISAKTKQFMAENNEIRQSNKFVKRFAWNYFSKTILAIS